MLEVTKMKLISEEEVTDKDVAFSMWVDFEHIVYDSRPDMMFTITGGGIPIIAWLKEIA